MSIGVFALLNIGASGLAAASARLAATAANLAQTTAPAARAGQPNTTPISDPGAAIDAAGRAETSTEALSGVNLAHESVNLVRVKHLYRANAQLIRVGDQLLGTLLDATAR